MRFVKRCDEIGDAIASKEPTEQITAEKKTNKKTNKKGRKEREGRKNEKKSIKKNITNSPNHRFFHFPPLTFWGMFGII